MKFRKPIIFSLLMISLAGCSDHGTTGNITDPPAAGGPISFASDVQPILETSCVFCHGSGDPAASVLYQRMTAVSNAMPPAGSLSSSTTSVVEQWIDEGALDN